MIAKATERVLPTLDTDGSRIKIRPRPAHGRFWTWRGVVAYGLIALFVALPFLEIGGKPALLIDLIRRELVCFGVTFRPSDGFVLMLLGLSIAATVFLVTALWGRVWCGWGCPQTVYLEWVFRPLERLIEGGVAGQRKLDAQGRWSPRRLVKYAVFGVLAVLVANVFLAYFVGIDQLSTWVFGSPSAHPVGFGVVVVVSALMFLDFAWFREQTCMVACPYGRLQSVLLDRQSMVIGYDAGRGEPRGKAKRGAAAAARTTGDCVDCGACVVTCPTGIDIRDGLQMECIGCAQCIDACDVVMDKLKRPRGLIRYTSQDELAGKPRRLLRPRTVIYPALLVVALSLLVWQVGDRPAAEVWVQRAEGAPFVTLEDGRVSTQIRLRVENRGDAARGYLVDFPDAPDVEVAAPRAPQVIEPGRSAVVTVVVFSAATTFDGGERKVTLRVRDDAGWVHRKPYTLLGPAGPAATGGTP